MTNEIPRWKWIWNPTLAQKARKDGAPGLPNCWKWVKRIGVDFKSENFRSFDEESRRGPESIRSNEKSPLILIKGDGLALYGRTRADKDRIIAMFDEKTDLLLWSWAGEWRTDVFRLTALTLLVGRHIREVSTTQS